MNPEQKAKALEVFKGEGHVPVVPPKIVDPIERPSLELIDKFRDAFLPDICDAVGSLYTMDSSIRALYPNAPRLVGSALTVRLPHADNTSVHYALPMIQKGDVLAVDARGDTSFCGTGGGSPMPAVARGMAGIIIDGGWRDIAELEAVGCPVYGKAISAYSPAKRLHGEINTAISIGGVIVHPGDIIVIDSEGGAVVPLEYAEEVADSLKPFQLHESLDDWDLKRIEASQSDGAPRREYFNSMFDLLGGKRVKQN